MGIVKELQQKIADVVKALYGEDLAVELTPAPENTGADYACNVALKLAKSLHKNPMDVAAEIVTELEKSNKAQEKGDLKLEVAKPGFVNIISPDEYLFEKIAKIGQKMADFGEIYSPSDIIDGKYDHKTVVAEFSDPNPFKVLHVGHLYTSVVGDSVSRLLEFAGARVVRANFGGDVGLHVGKTLWTIANGYKFENAFLTAGYHPDMVRKVLSRLSPSDLSIELIADAYVLGTYAYEEIKEAKAGIVKCNQEIYDIALSDKHDTELAKLYWRGRELSYQYFEDFYARIGVKFEKYYPESTVAERGLKEVREHIGEVYEESNGAVVYKGEKRGLHTRVFINHEGLPTYEAKDVGLIFTKWDDWKFDQSLVITGNDIIEYMKVVLTSVGEYAPELPKRTVHLTHGNVKLPGGVKMSSRKGNFLKAVDVLDLVSDELAKVREGQGDLAVDERIVLAAIKYAFLKYKMGGDIIFDPKESVAMTGNSGVYIIYSAVRARKVLEKCGQKTGKFSNITDEFVRKLSKKVVQYGEIIEQAVTELAPNKLCAYLYELAQEFSRFYEHVPVVGSEREAELKVLVQAYYNTMEHGLGLLGIEIPEEM